MEPGRIDETWYVRPATATRERVASGGVVVRIAGGDLLVVLVREIDTDGVVLEGYVIPKGGVQDGETIDEAAVREIEEEAGLTAVTKLDNLAITERQDSMKTYWAINHYALYLSTQVSGEIKDKEHHFDVGWFPIEQLPPMFWPDERRIIEENRAHIYNLVIAHQNPKPRKSMFM